MPAESCRVPAVCWPQREARFEAGKDAQSAAVLPPDEAGVFTVRACHARAALRLARRCQAVLCPVLECRGLSVGTMLGAALMTGAS